MMPYVMTIKDVSLRVCWSTDRNNKTYINIDAMKFGTNRILHSECTLSQFKNGYKSLKFLEELEHFEQCHYKTIKNIITQKVLGNKDYFLMDAFY